jgi:hypothetical protein
MISRKWMVLTAGLVVLASSATLIAQVKTTTTTANKGAVVSQVTIEHGQVVLISGNDVWVKDDIGQIRHFPNVPESVRVNVDGKQLGVHDLKVGMTVQRISITTTAPKVITTVKTVSGTVWHVTPPSSVILTMDNNENQKFKIPDGQKFMVNGQTVDAWGLKKGMKVSATQVVEVPATAITEKKILTGQMPAPPPLQANTPILIAFVGSPAPAPAPEVPAQSLPKTGSMMPLFGLLGLFGLGCSFAMGALRRMF